MKIKDLTKEELENMSYDDIAYMYIKEKGKKIKIIDLFNEVGKLVGLSDAVIDEKIGDFFEMLTLDKRFIMLDDGSWDLRDNHAQNIVIDDEEEDMGEYTEEEEDTSTNDEIFYDEEETDDHDDDLKDLVIIDEDETESM